MYFLIRDRGSGYYLTAGAGPGSWRMIPPRDKAFALIVEATDVTDRQLLRGIADVSEWFGENCRNGFELVPVPVGAERGSM